MINNRSLRLLIIDDEQIIHQTMTPYLQNIGYRIDNALDGIKALDLIKRNEYDLAFIDVMMPKMDGLSILSQIKKVCPELSVIIISGHGDMDTVIQALRLGAVDFLRKPIKLYELDSLLERSYSIRYIRQRQHYIGDKIEKIKTSGSNTKFGNTQLIGVSEAMNDVRRQIKLAVEAMCEIILISGETGTGKEVIARTIHLAQGGDERPFIAINCPALSDSLLDSELFGHVKGAFTGAIKDKPGAFEMANEGTLFLDEIADLSPSAQAKILRVLETRRLRRVGGTKEIQVKIHIITATNIPLEELLELKKIRYDLYYRLNLFTIKLAPLRERPVDIIPLAEYFLSNYKQGRKLKINGISNEAKDLLINYSFPGNVRELRNIIERAAILCQTGEIEPKHIHIPKCTLNKISYSNHLDENFNQLDEKQNLIKFPEISPVMPSYSGKLNKEQEKKKILEALTTKKWNRRQAAKAIDMPYSTFRYKLKKFGIS